SFGLFLIENGRNQVRRHRLEMGGFHRITGATLRKRTNGSRIAEQLGKRNFGMNDRQTAARFDVVDAPTTSAQVAADVALELIRRNVFDLHYRFQQNRFTLFKSIFHGEDRSHFEREFAGIDFVERAVNDIDLNIDNRIPPEHAVEHRFLDAFFDGRNVFARNDAADDFVLDDKTFAALGWAHVYFHVSILAAAA